MPRPQTTSTMPARPIPTLAQLAASGSAPLPPSPEGGAAAGGVGSLADAPGCGAAGDLGVGAHWGHDASILAAVACELAPWIHSTMPVQNVPEPTSLGITSEPSNTTAGASLAAAAMSLVVWFG